MRLKYLNAENDNYKHMLNNMNKEKDKLDQRLQQINDYSYIIALNQQIEDAKGNYYRDCAVRNSLFT